METFILIAGFIGGWLLVAGPIYQAALELKDEDLERDRINEVRSKITAPRHSSAWWWLLPPVKMVLEHRVSDQYRREFFNSLSQEDTESMVSFMNKANGWLFVAGGAFFIALKETYEMVEHFAWGMQWFWLLAALLSFLSFANTAVRMARSEKLLGNRL